ncbi:tRNA (adenosine(37)-N6)-threonylcarbamoyltransferase complex dimerization subunit type 1 TsaB [Cellulomonas carbonis]|uniref:Gcp-like domain-containing protein n=2 Tax=Cellulomonas carbonis TaxID=1386092 RepID=A0A0A0BN63_9CELL|nr:hypothetical protein N868_17635 [Cellulomonas carbonis T26]
MDGVLLALDTSADLAVAVVGPDGEPLARRRLAEQRHHAELLAPLVLEALADAGADRRALTAVVAGTGPAPFTGLRAGLVTARTFAFALGLPVHGVPSLDAVALAARDVARAGDEVLVVTDARRREVYVARYAVTDDGVHLVQGPEVQRPADVVVGGAVVVGAGAHLYADVLPPGDGAPVEVDPVLLARLALDRAAAGVDQPAEPLYLRRPDVTPAGGRKRATA